MEKNKIFVVDDSLVARNMLIRMLSNQDDLEVVGEAGSGEGCLIMLDEVNPDIVLLEAGINGSMRLVDIIKEIKEMQPNILVIICADSGRFESERIIEANHAGASDFITKPYKQGTVLRTIRTVAALRSENI